MRLFKSLFRGMSLAVLYMACSAGGAIGQSTKQLVDIPFAGTIATTGPLADVYTGFVRAMALALTENEKKLAAAGWRIPKDGVFSNEDTQQRVERALPSYQLQYGRGARIITSVITPIVTAQAQAAKRDGALIFGPYLQGPELADLDNFLVGMVLADVEARPLGFFAAKSLGAKTAAVIFVDDKYGSQTAAAFKKVFEENGSKVVAELPIPSNPVDFRNEATRIGVMKPDLVFIVHRGGYRLVIETLRDGGYEGQLMAGTASLVAGDLPAIGSTGKGMVISTITGTEKDLRAFYARYKARWGQEPPAASVAIPYAATEILVAALARTPASKDFDVRAFEKTWMGLGTVKTLVGPANVTGRSVIYPINLEMLKPDGSLQRIGNCTAEKCQRTP